MADNAPKTTDDVKQIVQDLEQQTQVDYVNVSAGVHHAFIHTPMEFEAGWERGYARGIKDVTIYRGPDHESHERGRRWRQRSPAHVRGCRRHQGQSGGRSSAVDW